MHVVGGINAWLQESYLIHKNDEKQLCVRYLILKIDFEFKIDDILLIMFQYFF